MEENLKQQNANIIKIALFGPESTGKTTLAKQLAKHFETEWAPEFARDYLQQKWDATQKICEPEDMIPIAIGQTKAENDALLTANGYLFCDTTALVTKVFSEIYYNFCDPTLEKAARKHKYDLFFLTDVDVPWQKDDLRDRPENREQTFEIFKNALVENGKPFITLSGNSEQRLEKAIAILKKLEESKKMGFTSLDFVQIYDLGIQLEDIAKHLVILKNGISKTILDRAATIGDGIVKLSDAEFDYSVNYFNERKDNLKLKKFVPASGAASRMFKFLTEFIHEFNIEEESINAYINRKNATALSVFLVGLEKFPFYDATLLHLQKNYSNFKSWSKDLRDYYFIKSLLSSKNFDFANKPKGVLPFHKYDAHIATPVEEHLNESAYYANANSVSHLHFTISESHQQEFESILASVKNKIEIDTKNNIHVRFSFQDSATDTIAVDFDDNPMRDENNKLIFRPAGHGALIENLNNLDADIVFIKNIDNVIQNHIETIAYYKKALAGILIELQQEIFKNLESIEEGKINQENIFQVIQFVREKLKIELLEDFEKYTLDNKISSLENILNRPIRVCGMVKNEGEPGGGPFWVYDKKGYSKLQIVETSQIDIENNKQLQILKSATHFNPVDLVCGIKNYRGDKFDLKKFVDTESGFIVEKTKHGKKLKAYELPGLWNGAMSKWITIFIQVPLITFNPVKTVNDLLKPAHQPQ